MKNFHFEGDYLSTSSNRVECSDILKVEVLDDNKNWYKELCRN